GWQRGQPGREGAPADFRDFADTLARLVLDYRTRGVADPRHLKAWWVYRMLWGPDPLGERLTLLWHNHFATSYAKVNDLAAIRRQNDIFRKHGRGPFGTLLKAVVHDPALLIWLDAPVNRKGQPNENLGRELMELFTLGVGHYTEQDVKEAARALTGWSVKADAFADVPASHDDGGKTILGKKGRWKGDDLVRILLEHPATSRRLAWRIGEGLMGEKAVAAGALHPLAAGLRKRDLDIGRAGGAGLGSPVLFARAQ